MLIISNRNMRRQRTSPAHSVYINNFFINLKSCLKSILAGVSFYYSISSSNKIMNISLFIFKIKWKKHVFSNKLRSRKRQTQLLKSPRQKQRGLKRESGEVIM
jgi:hypothetical protein